MIKKDFIVQRTITEVEGKPHVETYSEEELIRCKNCKNSSQLSEWFNCMFLCKLRHELHVGDWYCADALKKEDEKK